MPFPSVQTKSAPNPIYAPSTSSDSPEPGYRLAVILTGNRQIFFPFGFTDWQSAITAHDMVVREFDETNMIRWAFHEERVAIAINGDQVLCIKVVQRSDERRPRVREARA